MGKYVSRKDAETWIAMNRSEMARERGMAQAAKLTAEDIARSLKVECGRMSPSLAMNDACIRDRGHEGACMSPRVARF
jgi:DNA-binding phage protein